MILFAIFYGVCYNTLVYGPGIIYRPELTK